MGQIIKDYGQEKMVCGSRRAVPQGGICLRRALRRLADRIGFASICGVRFQVKGGK